MTRRSVANSPTTASLRPMTRVIVPGAYSSSAEICGRSPENAKRTPPTVPDTAARRNNAAMPKFRATRPVNRLMALTVYGNHRVDQRAFRLRACRPVAAEPSVDCALRADRGDEGDAGAGRSACGARVGADPNVRPVARRSA